MKAFKQKSKSTLPLFIIREYRTVGNRAFLQQPRPPPRGVGNSKKNKRTIDPLCVVSVQSTYVCLIRRREPRRQCRAGGVDDPVHVPYYVRNTKIKILSLSTYSLSRELERAVGKESEREGGS